MVDRWIAVAFLWFYFALCLNGEENFRTFTTTGGKSFPFRVLSYEGQDFYFEDQSKKQYKVNYKQFSASDQKYLIEVATNGKIPKGDPRKMEVKEVAPTPESQNAGVSSSTQNVTVQGERLKAPPKKKPKLRPGSFFAYQPVKLGQDPNLAIEKKQGGMPKPGEPIDFTNHVLPILETAVLVATKSHMIKTVVQSNLKLDSLLILMNW